MNQNELAAQAAEAFLTSPVAEVEVYNAADYQPAQNSCGGENGCGGKEVK